jgi:MFS family permease
MELQKEQDASHMEHNKHAHEHEITDEMPEEDYSVGLRTWLAIIALSLANCCATVSNTTNTTIKFQVISVGGAANASWIANGNFLLTLACGPIFGSLADRLGKKWFIVGGCALGVAGSFISSSATDIYTIIGGNILTGIAVSLRRVVRPPSIALQY